ILVLTHTVEHDPVRARFHALTYAKHDLGHKWPCEGRDQYSNKPRTPTSKPGGCNVGNVFVLVHDSQDPLARHRINVWLLIDDARDRCLRHTRQAGDV